MGLAITPYPGPFPRKRHAHRCLNCGQGRSTACYKAHCTLPRVVTSCPFCRVSPRPKPPTFATRPFAG